MYSTFVDTMMDRHGGVGVQGRNNAARSSITTKNNNVFTTRDSETGGIVEKRMANNYKVTIRQSKMAAQNRNKTQVRGDFEKQRFVDLYHNGKVQGPGALNNIRLKSQIMIYGGSSAVDKLSGDEADQVKTSRNMAMHKTLT